VNFDWDDRKAESNRRKHGITFERAAEAFRDPLHDTIDDEFAIGEHRFKTIGLVRGIGLVIVIHTVENEGEPTELIRIISARQAGRREQKAYENE
jgi:uncharacterized DUF497 family protein